MKKFWALMIVFALLLSPVFALKGIGIKYGVEYTTVSEGAETCFSYGIYNPWDESVVAELTADGDLAQFVEKARSKEIPGGTNSGDAIKIDICFDVPKKTLDSCDEPKIYEGNIIAQEKKDDSIGGIGSATSTIITAPLTLEVVCSKGVTGASVVGTAGSSLGLGAFLIAILAVLGYGVSRFRKRQQPVTSQPVEAHTVREIYMQKYGELMALHARIKAGESNPELLRQYQSLREYLEHLKADM